MSPVCAHQYNYYYTFDLGEVFEFNSDYYGRAYSYDDKCKAFQSCDLLSLVAYSKKGTGFNKFKAVSQGTKVVKTNSPFWIDPNYYHITVFA
jgi:hypothetical protein